MVFWICLAAVVVGLGVLLVLLVELRAKQRRLLGTMDVAQKQAEQANEIIGALQGIQPPKRPAKASRHTLATTVD